MRLRLITPAAAEPVTLEEVKAALRIDGSVDDALIAGYLDSATGQLDGRDGILGRALVTQTWELVLPIFPAAQLTIPLPPLRSIVSIKYRNSTNVETTLDPSEYEVDVDSVPGLVFPVTSWPGTYCTQSAVVVRFEAGYGAAEAVPAPIKSAIFMRVQALFDNLKPDDAAAVDRACASLLFPYRLVLP